MYIAYVLTGLYESPPPHAPPLGFGRAGRTVCENPCAMCNHGVWHFMDSLVVISIIYIDGFLSICMFLLNERGCPLVEHMKHVMFSIRTFLSSQQFQLS
jgi:hypothetical protein